MSDTITAFFVAERFAEHANRLAIATAKRLGGANINYEMEVRREFLWLKRKLAEMEPVFAMGADARYATALVEDVERERWRNGEGRGS